LKLHTEARVVIEDYRTKYNQRRPHSKLGYQSPARYAAKLYPSLAPVPSTHFSDLGSSKICHGFASKRVFDLFSLHLDAPFLLFELIRKQLKERLTKQA
jgi:hypothetical protein